VTPIKTIDLTSHLVVLGSGLTAASVIEVFNEAEKKFAIIDAGFTEKNNASSEELKIFSKKFTSPKLASKNESFAYSGFQDSHKIIEKNFSSIGSLATGGLSNIWGAGIHHYNMEEVANIFPSISSNHLAVAYQRVHKLVQENPNLQFDSVQSLEKVYPEIELNSACEKLYKNQNLDVSSIKFNLPINAIKRNQKNILTNNQDSWMGDFKNLTTFNSKISLSQIKKNNNNLCISNTLINSISMKDEIYIIKCTDLRTSEKFQIKAKNIFCCLGVLATSKIVLEMKQKFDFQLPLLNTPGAGFISLCFARNYKPGNLGLNNLTFEFKTKGEFITGGFFPMTQNLFSKVSKEWLLPRIIKTLLYKLIFSRLIISNVFFPSTYSNNSISLSKKNILSIIGKNQLGKIRSVYTEILNELSPSLKKEKIIILPFFRKILRPGEDIHYAGTLPNNEFLDTNISCDKMGQLKNCKDFYICDSSSMNYLSGKPHSFNAMVNATIIAMTFLDSQKDHNP
jgi:hypothetical protein